MRKVLVWTGAAAAVASAALGWVVQAALGKAATFVYAIIVSVVANVVFDHVKALHPAETALTPGGAATATAVIRIRPQPAGEGVPNFSLPVSLPASLPPPDTGVTPAAPAAPAEEAAAAAPTDGPAAASAGNPGASSTPTVQPIAAAVSTAPLPAPDSIDIATTSPAAPAPTATAAAPPGPLNPPQVVAIPAAAEAKLVRARQGSQPGPGSGGLY